MLGAGSARSSTRRYRNAAASRICFVASVSGGLGCPSTTRIPVPGTCSMLNTWESPRSTRRPGGQSTMTIPREPGCWNASCRWLRWSTAVNRRAQAISVILCGNPASNGNGTCPASTSYPRRRNSYAVDTATQLLLRRGSAESKWGFTLVRQSSISRLIRSDRASLGGNHAKPSPSRRDELPVDPLGSAYAANCVPRAWSMSPSSPIVLCSRPPVCRITPARAVAPWSTSARVTSSAARRIATISSLFTCIAARPSIEKNQSVFFSKKTFRALQPLRGAGKDRVTSRKRDQSGMYSRSLPLTWGRGSPSWVDLNATAVI